MENPMTWSEADRVVDRAHSAWAEAHAEGVVGLSLTRCITDALRAEGLLVPEATWAQKRKLTWVDPPSGWYVFGTHAGWDKDDQPDLEFSEETGADGMPLFERPMKETG